jgi:transaldolase
MLKSNIDELARYGQSIWLDSISRSMIKTGRLQELINAGLRGMTSNPTIFEKAISSSSDYDEQIKELLHRGKSTFEIYDDITVTDVQNAADIFKPVYEKTGGLDGYVSLEVNPKLAFQTEETLREARRLHKKVGRPNVMFKVPATDAGFPAAEELLAECININITLIFSIEQYVKTAHAYLNGIKRLSEKKSPLKNIASVASVFVSRIDTAVDSLIDEKVSGDKDITHKIAQEPGQGNGQDYDCRQGQEPLSHGELWQACTIPARQSMASRCCRSPATLAPYRTASKSRVSCSIWASGKPASLSCCSNSRGVEASARRRPRCSSSTRLIST